MYIYGGKRPPIDKTIQSILLSQVYETNPSAHILTNGSWYYLANPYFYICDTVVESAQHGPKHTLFVICFFPVYRLRQCGGPLRLSSYKRLGQPSMPTARRSPHSYSARQWVVTNNTASATPLIPVRVWPPALIKLQYVQCLGES